MKVFPTQNFSNNTKKQNDSRLTYSNSGEGKVWGTEKISNFLVIISIETPKKALKRTLWARQSSNDSCLLLAYVFLVFQPHYFASASTFLQS